MLKKLIIPQSRFHKSILLAIGIILIYLLFFHIAFVLYPLNITGRDVVANRNQVVTVHSISGVMPILLSLISIGFAFLLYLKYINFRTYTYDLVIDYQAIVNTTRGHFFATNVEADYVLIDKKDADYKIDNAPKVENYRAQGFLTVFENDGIVILKRQGI